MGGREVGTGAAGAHGDRSDDWKTVMPARKSMVLTKVADTPMVADLLNCLRAEGQRGRAGEWVSRREAEWA